MDILVWAIVGFAVGAYSFDKRIRDRVNGYIKRFFNKNKKRS
jgi:hypothetical protein